MTYFQGFDVRFIICRFLLNMQKKVDLVKISFENIILLTYRPLGTKVDMIVHWVQIGQSTWLPGPVMHSDWLKFHAQKLTT